MKLGSIVQSCNNMVQWVNNGVDVICYLNLWFILVYSGGTWTCKTSITNLWARFNLGDLINFIPLCQFNMFPYLPSCPWWLHREPIPMFWQEVKYRVLFLPFLNALIVECFKSLQQTKLITTFRQEVVWNFISYVCFLEFEAMSCVVLQKNTTVILEVCFTTNHQMPHKPLLWLSSSSW